MNNLYHLNKSKTFWYSRSHIPHIWY